MIDIILAGLRVLVVEDEMLVSMMIEDILAEELCVVVGPFDRVPKAIAAAEHDAIDAAILDINVAGTKAFAVGEILEKRGIPFLFVSGYGQKAVPPDHQNWRVCDKPFKHEVLVAMLREQIGKQF